MSQSKTKLDSSTLTVSSGPSGFYAIRLMYNDRPGVYYANLDGAISVQEVVEGTNPYLFIAGYAAIHRAYRILCTRQNEAWRSLAVVRLARYLPWPEMAVMDYMEF